MRLNDAGISPQYTEDTHRENNGRHNTMKDKCTSLILYSQRPEAHPREQATLSLSWIFHTHTHTHTHAHTHTHTQRHGRACEHIWVRWDMKRSRSLRMDCVCMGLFL